MYLKCLYKVPISSVDSYSANEHLISLHDLDGHVCRPIKSVWVSSQGLQRHTSILKKYQAHISSGASQLDVTVN